MVAPSRPLPRWLQATSGQTVLDRRRASKERPAGGAVSVSPSGIPAVLRQRHQWALWRYTTDSRGATSKPPSQPNGDPADGANPGTWSSFQDCFDAYREGGWDGLSYALVESQDLAAFDLDHFREHQTRDEAIIRALNSYTEWSPSGDGVHVWARGHLPEGRRRRDDVEIYSRRRFLSVTGQLYPGAPATIRHSPNLHAIWRTWVQQDG
jgi:primase-polymerase (primpol)-like protein